MRFLIYLMITVILILLVWPLVFPESLIEGMETEGAPSSNPSSSDYQPYNLNDPNNALILSQQNAGNIDYLKGRIDDLSGIKKDVEDMKMNISSMQTQIDGLVQQQADYATEIAGSQPPEVSGLEEEEE